MNGAEVLRVPLPMTELVEKEMPNIEELETGKNRGYWKDWRKQLITYFPEANPSTLLYEVICSFKWIAETFKGSHRRETLQLLPVS
jgi:hypothetical protein